MAVIVTGDIRLHKLVGSKCHERPITASRLRDSDDRKSAVESIFLDSYGDERAHPITDSFEFTDTSYINTIFYHSITKTFSVITRIYPCSN